MTEQHYLKVIQKWLWLMALAMIVAAVSAYIATLSMPTFHQASSKVMIGPGVDSPGTNFDTLRTSGQLMQTYAELPKTTPFLKAVISELNLNVAPSDLEKMIEVESNNETQMITINVQNQSEDTAILIANTVASRLISLSQSGGNTDQGLINQQLKSQIEKLENNITTTEENISTLEMELETSRQDHINSDVFKPVNIAAQEKSLKDFETEIQMAGSAEDLHNTANRALTNLLVITNRRLETLDDSLQKTANLSVQSLILSQISLERNHLSEIQYVIADISRQVESRSLEEQLTSIQDNINRLEDQLNDNLVLDMRIFLDNQLKQERDRLNAAQQIGTNRQQAVLDTIAQERIRISDLEKLNVETQQVLLSQIDQERSRLADQRDALSRLYQPLSTVMANQARVIELADSAVPLPTKQGIYILLAGIAGLVISLALVFGYEFMSGEVESLEDLVAATGRPALGKISARPGPAREGLNTLAIQQYPNSQAAQDYQLLGAKLLYTINSQGIHSLMVSSLQQSEDASRTGANLAAVLSMVGKRVILLDLNKSPKSSPETADISLDVTPGPGSVGSDAARRSPLIPINSLPGLFLYNSSFLSQGSYKGVASARLYDLIKDLEDKADLVMVVSTPFSQANSYLLASQVDGVILIAEAGRAKQKTLREVCRTLQEAGANLISSILLNRPPLLDRMANSMFGKPKGTLRKSAGSQPSRTDVTGLNNRPSPDTQSSTD